MESFSQDDFSGGLNLFELDHKLAPNEYVLAYNLRTRDNSLTPIKAPQIESTQPLGIKQLMLCYTNVSFLVAQGFVYYKDEQFANSSWILIAGATLNPAAPVVYAQAVPLATTRYQRKLQTAGVINGSLSAGTGVNLISDTIINGNVSGILMQDGVSQPIFVYQDEAGTWQSRLTQTYDEWNGDNREYVPIGRQMAYSNGILWIVAPDNKTLYRSVSYRPLDFVVNIQINGSKGGDASTTSYAVTANNITGLYPLDSGELLVSTVDVCHLVEYSDVTIFGEPYFQNRRTVNVGIVNHQSLLNVLGDYVGIDLDGIRSFNAVSQMSNEGRNSVFSRKINSLLVDAKQSAVYSAIASFDNYLLFAVTTNQGNAVLVFDTLKNVWVSVDKYNIGRIKGFAVSREAIDPTIYAYTDDNVYKLFAGSEWLESEFRPQSVVSGNSQIELSINNVRVVFLNPDTPDKVYVDLFTNTIRGNTLAKQFFGISTPLAYPLNYPIYYSSSLSKIENLNFPFAQLKSTGWKVTAVIRWTNGAKLARLQFDLATNSSVNSRTQQGKPYVS